MINLRLNGTARTWVLTLRARADEHHRKSNKLFEDQWSADWYDFMPRFDDYDRWYSPNFQLATAIRTQLIDERVKRFIDSVDNPLVVEIGAGFSTRYYRIGKDKSMWLDHDMGPVISARRKIDVEAPDHWFISGNILQADRWLPRLPEADPESTLFIAEGVLMFLQPKHVKDLFATLGAHAPGATAIFDVINDSYMQQASDEFDKLRAPIYWSANEQELEKMNMDVLNTSYILTEYPDRWDEIGVGRDRLTKTRSGYVVEARLTS